MVGDTTPDIRAAKSAGVFAVGVLCGFGEQQELEDAGANILLKSTAELGDYLLGPAPRAIISALNQTVNPHSNAVLALNFSSLGSACPSLPMPRCRLRDLPF